VGGFTLEAILEQLRGFKGEERIEAEEKMVSVGGA
jgi:hypothetical protein